MKPARSSGSFGPVLHAFFLERLVAQRNASPRTVAAYRDSCAASTTFAGVLPQLRMLPVCDLVVRT
jgi:hypothetical protein